MCCCVPLPPKEYYSSKYTRSALALQKHWFVNHFCTENYLDILLGFFSVIPTLLETPEVPRAQLTIYHQEIKNEKFYCLFYMKLVLKF